MSRTSCQHRIGCEHYSPFAGIPPIFPVALHALASCAHANSFSLQMGPRPFREGGAIRRHGRGVRDRGADRRCQPAARLCAGMWSRRCSFLFAQPLRSAIKSRTNRRCRVVMNAPLEEVNLRKTMHE
eukprot:scaffold29234_cov35-Tisochrysis_lutea.AAC.2